MINLKVVLAPSAIGMTAHKVVPSLVKAILPFAPVVGVVSTCLLVASAVAQVAEPILNAGIGLQVNIFFRFRIIDSTGSLIHLFDPLFHHETHRSLSFSSTSLEELSATGFRNSPDLEKSKPVPWPSKRP